ncbi:unnamed protein product [Staurois parvus]|uniref:nucleoside-diphosphate kinase n=1 Tax=Staurois parvus TaxID=386267 RepID=A0ABN9GWL1_9NEOB|nr:unnamed protein product [Staurois parvus]
MTANKECTFITIKPDGVQRGLIGDIIKRFKQKQHHIDLKDCSFFNGLVEYMGSSPVVAMVWQGMNVVKIDCVMLGETNPVDSKPSTIRGDFCIQVERNICHRSDSVESAKKEIALRFKDDELVEYSNFA